MYRPGHQCDDIFDQFLQWAFSFQDAFSASSAPSRRPLSLHGPAYGASRPSCMPSHQSLAFQQVEGLAICAIAHQHPATTALCCQWSLHQWTTPAGHICWVCWSFGGTNPVPSISVKNSCRVVQHHCESS